MKILVIHATAGAGHKKAAEAIFHGLQAREGFERIENDISYLKAYYDIFMAAHVFYRQLSKQNS